MSVAATQYRLVIEESIRKMDAVVDQLAQLNKKLAALPPRMPMRWEGDDS